MNAHDTFAELGDKFEYRVEMRDGYERSVASKARILDVGGRNQQSRTVLHLRSIGAADAEIVATDVLPGYRPDLVDDITDTNIPPESFDAINCVAVLEHVKDYWAAIDNMHAILRPGGEVFIYVPFVYRMHDEMDYHRFTVAEVARMLDAFSEVKVFPPGGGGYGWVLGHVLTYGKIERFPSFHRMFTTVVNGVLTVAAKIVYRFRRPNCTQQQFVTWAVALNYNHGFCAWARK